MGHRSVLYYVMGRLHRLCAEARIQTKTIRMATYGALTSLAGFQRHHDARKIAQWTYNSTSQTLWSCDNHFVVRAKTLYVNRRVVGGLGGRYVSAFKADEANGALVKTKAAILGTGRNEPLAGSYMLSESGISDLGAPLSTTQAGQLPSRCCRPNGLCLINARVAN